MAEESKVRVEVAYALPHKQRVLSVEVDDGTSVAEAARQSGITREFPELDLSDAKFGVFGKAVRNAESEAVKEGDRVEIYRPLIIDPKQARANRAAKAAEKAR
ncbi:MAG: RnfH family protein [Oceanospirillaceae bacterium]|nr:RnfH family protein [Oceanospirillaceae bacterium]|tara:strand:- start:227 stop:535 length:309 start_codon:yes stop_codon:yes gene_type:complete